MRKQTQISFVSDLVRNPEDRFCHNEAHIPSFVTKKPVQFQQMNRVFEYFTKLSLQQNGSELHMIGQIEICLTKEFKVRTCYSKDGIADKPTSYRSKDTGILYYEKRRHRSGPQSDCPRHYNFYYPPMHYQVPALG